MVAAVSVEPRWNGNADAVSAVSSLAVRAFADSREAAQAIFGLIHGFFGFRVCVLTRVDLEENTLTLLEHFDRAGVGLASGMVVPADEMPCDFVVRSAKALKQYDLESHPVFSRLPFCTKLRMRSYVGVPLRRSDGSIWGTLAASDLEPRETSDADLELLAVLARLAAHEFERDEQREALAAYAKLLEERLAMAQALEEERVRAVRLQAVLEAAATVSHEINNPLTVMQLRLDRLAKRYGDHPEATEDVQVARESADEIHQVTLRLRKVVRPVSTEYLRGDVRMLDLEASLRHDRDDSH